MWTSIFCAFSANRVEKRMNERTKKLEVEVVRLKEDMSTLKTHSRKNPTSRAPGKQV